MEMNKHGLTPAGPGLEGWWFADPPYKEVRKFLRGLQADKEDAERDEEPDLERGEENRWRNLEWIFTHMVRDEEGLSLPDLTGVDDFEMLGWNRLRRLEAAVMNFLTDQLSELESGES